MFPLTTKGCFIIFQLLGACNQPVQHPSHHVATIQHQHLARLPRPDPRIAFTTTPWTNPGPYPTWFHWKEKYPLPSRRVQIWGEWFV